MHDEHQDRHNTNSLLAVIALLAAVPALIISILAYNRSGRDLDQEINSRLDSVEQAGSLALAKTNAAVKLTVLRARIEADAAGDDVQGQLNEIENGLKVAYENAGDQFTSEWRDIEQDFNQVGEALESGANNTLELIQNLIEKLQENIRD